MSEDDFHNNSHATHSASCLKEKSYELQTRVDEKENNPARADDALDDSSSSYCTALCSLSEYSEALEEETQTTFTDQPCGNVSSETPRSVESIRNNSEETQDDSREKMIYGENKDSALESIESKQPSSSPKITVLNVTLININSGDVNQGSNPTGTPNSTPLDNVRSKQYAAQSDTQPVQLVGSMEQKNTANTSLNTGQGTYNQESRQEHNDFKPTTFQKSLGNDHYKPGTVSLDGVKSVISKTKCKGEERSIRVGKEPTGQPLNTGNRKLPPGCTSTLTANKQKSGILPRCYSKRLLTTGKQRQSQSPLTSRRLKHQDGAAIKLSTLLPQTPCSSTREHCRSTADTEGKSSMATKVVSTKETSEVGCIAALEYTRTPSPETNYLDVFNPSCWSSTRLSSNRYVHGWPSDGSSFKMPMISTEDTNTSACSEVSSFECIDVALGNHEPMDRDAKTVPKRQIQLKRQDDAECHVYEKDVTPSTPSWPRDTLQRQHSMPAAFYQDSSGSESKCGQPEEKQTLQKSLSLDETSGKTKMASCIIKNILSKRMQHEQNFHSVDIPDQTVCPFKADGRVNKIDCLTSCVKEECTEINERNSATVHLLSCQTDLQTESQTMSSIKEHISVSSKILPKLITKHSFNPLLGGLGRTQFQESGTEIAAYSETEKQKMSPRKEVNQVGGERLSGHSANGKVWSLSAATSRAVGKQAKVKTKPEECVNVQAAHYVKDPGENEESTQSPVLLQSAQCNLNQCDQENGKGELGPLGQSVNMAIQSQRKFKAIAPVHVVRDMRSLVKNTYSLPFRGPTELDVPGFAAAGPNPVISKMENKIKGRKQAGKLHASNATLADKFAHMNLSFLESTPNECATKASSILESKRKISHTGFTKVSPISAAQTHSCGLSKSLEAQNSTTPMSQTNSQCSNKYRKKTTCASKSTQAHKALTYTAKKEQCTDTKNPESKKSMHATQPLTSATPYCSPTQSSDKSLSSGPSSACILTVAPAPVFQSYLYETNVISYQTISANIGTVGYVHGPVFLQTPPHKQTATASGSIPLKKSLSSEERLRPQPQPPPAPQEPSKQMENGDSSQKISRPDTQPSTAFIATLGAEGIHGGAGILYPEMSVSQHVLNPRHRLLDPETGQCFYVDMPQLPQRKMLFDPETCQYVEVVVPQQTLSSSFLTTSCTLPFPSLHIPATYTPQCMSYVQTHHKVLAPPEP